VELHAAESGVVERTMQDACSDVALVKSIQVLVREHELAEVGNGFTLFAQLVQNEAIERYVPEARLGLGSAGHAASLTLADAE